MDGVGVGFLRILGVGVGVGIFDPTPTPKVQFNYLSTCFSFFQGMQTRERAHFARSVFPFIKKKKKKKTSPVI